MIDNNKIIIFFLLLLLLLKLFAINIHPIVLIYDYGLLENEETVSCHIVGQCHSTSTL